MTGHNAESDANLTITESEPTSEHASSPAGGQVDAADERMPPAEPGDDTDVGEAEPTGSEPAETDGNESVTGESGGDTDVGEPEPTGSEPAETDEHEPATGEFGGDTDVSEPEPTGSEPAETDGHEPAMGEPEEPASVEGALPAGAGEEGEAPAVPVIAADAGLDPQVRKRRRLWAALAALTVLLIAAVVMFILYLAGPEPLPDLLPLPVEVNYRPHYLFSIYGVERPVGVAVSADGERIYATETGGGREVKAFDRDGRLLHTFSPPSTGPAERAPVYVAVDPAGRVFVTDRLQRAVFVYDQEGNLLDAILGPDLTLSEYVSKHVGDLEPDSTFAYNLFGGLVRVQTTSQGEQVLPAPEPAPWAPLGVRVDGQGTMLLTDVVQEQHAIREFPGDLIMASTWRQFDPQGMIFGAYGQGNGEFMYPNSAVADSQGRIHVTDGNNGRISVWDAQGTFLFNFGRGVGESALSLPRGAAIDRRDRLHIVDTVDQGVKVYDVSEPEPRFLFAFGDWGTADGEFNYPGDIALDGTGRLYIADRENNRIQVWSY